MSSFDFGPPPPINRDNIEILRVTDPSTGKVVTKYMRKGTTDEVLPPTYSLQKADAGFIPPPG